MTYAREPVLQPVPIESLRPTQITVGMREVDEKRKRLRKQKPRKVGSFIGRHMIPVVLGPKKRHYVIDHHHLSLALHKEGLRDVLVTVVLDLSALDLNAFWTVLDHKSLVYPFDPQGRRRDFADIPKTVMQLKDDPFRSLAGELRRAGGTKSSAAQPRKYSRNELGDWLMHAGESVRRMSERACARAGRGAAFRCSG